jgi:Flp pilus assembly secretin CpaC
MRLSVTLVLILVTMTCKVGHSNETTAPPAPISKTNTNCTDCCKSNCRSCESVERLEHLLEAVHHLEAAGLQKEADQMRRQMDGEIKAVIQSLKQSDMESSTQVSIQLELLEVDLTKLRNLGIDLETALGQLAKIIDGSPVTMDADATRKVVDALLRENLAKTLVEPQLVTLSGRPTRFVSGGEFPLPLQQSASLDQIDCGNIGARIDILPLISGKDNIHLEISFELAEIQTIERNDEGHKAVRTQQQYKTKLDLRDGQAAILSSPLHRQTTTAIERIRKPSGDLEEKEVTSEFVRLLLVRPSIVESPQ